jgi:hypothetical protein
VRPGSITAELTIRVPGPFAGVDDLGFSARYPEQNLFEPLRDVPLWIEGPASPLRRLLHRLKLLHASAEGRYAWTDPVQLAEQVLIVAFRDLSGERPLAESPQAYSDYFANLVRPVVFPFLADCARVAHLRLADVIDVAVEAADWPVARFALGVTQIVDENGFDLLGDAA